jgi:hypothetical protein
VCDRIRSYTIVYDRIPNTIAYVRIYTIVYDRIRSYTIVFYLAIIACAIAYDRIRSYTIVFQIRSHTIVYDRIPASRTYQYFRFQILQSICFDAWSQSDCCLVGCPTTTPPLSIRCCCGLVLVRLGRLRAVTERGRAASQPHREDLLRWTGGMTAAVPKRFHHGTSLFSFLFLLLLLLTF